MLRLRKLWIAVIALFTSITSQAAPILVISDIDDTLKLSRIIGRNEPVEQMNQMLFKNQAFSGSSEVLNGLDRMGSTIYYVSGMPTQVKWLADHFLRENGFPQSDHLILRPRGVETESYKKTAIEKLLKKFPGHSVIFIGDNGQKDPLVYQAFEKQLSSRLLFSFIHELYVGAPSQPVRHNQIPFVTYAEVVAHLEARGIFSSDVAYPIIQSIISDAESARCLVLPHWSELKTRDLERIWSRLPANIAPSTRRSLDKLFISILSRYESPHFYTTPVVNL